jgi:heat shock protein HslJ/uncharacterized lipoprotein YbaY
MSFVPNAGTGVLLVSFLLLAACITPADDARAAEPAGDRTVIRGALAYNARIALPEDAVAVVELRDARVADGPLVAERRIPLRGRQAPIGFELAVARRVLLPDVPYAARGTILIEGKPAWVSEAKTVDVSAGVVDLGTLTLAPYTVPPIVWTMRCGDATITIAFREEQARLQVGGETFELRQVMAASGVRYMALDDLTTSVWSKGERVRLTLRGKEYPECTRVQDAAASLRGAEWVVEDIDGGGIVDGSHATLTFGEDGRVTGSTSCNSYSAGYTVTGDSLTFTQAASTLKACVPALMTQEERFMSVFRDVRTFTITPDGALVLRTADGRTMTARRG